MAEKSGKLTTHVLDTANGRPGSGIRIELFRIDEAGQRHTAGVFVTNDDGRCDQPILDGDWMNVGTWELVFQAGDYFRALGIDLPEPAFLDEIPIRFGIFDADQHYHVPLLVSPWSYSTYRGS